MHTSPVELFIERLEMFWNYDIANLSVSEPFLFFSRDEVFNKTFWLKYGINSYFSFNYIEWYKHKYRATISHITGQSLSFLWLCLYFDHLRIHLFVIWFQVRKVELEWIGKLGIVIIVNRSSKYSLALCRLKYFQMLCISWQINTTIFICTMHKHTYIK